MLKTIIAVVMFTLLVGLYLTFVTRTQSCYGVFGQQLDTTQACVFDMIHTVK